MTAPRVIVAFDPSVSCTGWAVLAIDGSADGRLREKGTHRPDDKQKLPAKIAELHRDVSGLLKELQAWSVVAMIVVEFPVASKRKPSAGFRKRSGLTLPSYGIAVGAVYGPALTFQENNKGVRIITPAADQWTGGDIPSTENDEHKTERVALVESMYDLQRGELGAPTYAGNVADAVLLARWGLGRIDAPKELQRT